MTQGEQFIDEDSGYSNQKNSYEEIVLRQIRETAVLLSKDLIGSRTKQDGRMFTRTDDLRKAAYSSVDTLRMLLIPFIKDDATKDKIENIKEQIKDYLEKIGNKEILLRGKKIKIKDTILDSNDVNYNLLWEFKLDKARELFEILVSGYQKNKSYLASFETE